MNIVNLEVYRMRREALSLPVKALREGAKARQFLDDYREHDPELDEMEKRYDEEMDKIVTRELESLGLIPNM